MSLLERDLDDLVGRAQGPAILGATVTAPAGAARPEPWRAQYERCKPWLAEALEGSLYTADDLERVLSEGRAKLWPGKGSAIVTEIERYPTETVMRCWLGGGDMDELLGMAPGVMAEGRMQGCVSAIVEGRKGWEKALKGLGFGFYSATFRAVL